MDDATRALFADAVDRATASRSGVALDAALADLGWLDALTDDPPAAVSVLFEAQGAANVTSSALDMLLAHTIGAAGGELPGDVAVVLPPLRTADAPARIDRDRCAVHGLLTGAAAHCDTALVVAHAGDGDALVVAKVSDLVLQPVRGMDPELGLAVVAGECTLSSSAVMGRADWDGAVALGRLALGHELVGSARAMLELARLHALARIQFGRPISSFQAVRHRLAESLVAIEAAAALLDAAWDEPSSVTAAMAKGMAGRSARTVARHCQQVLAGIGFTTEHPLHRHVRRVLVLDQLLGAGTVLTRQLGAEVLERRTLPAPFPL